MKILVTGATGFVGTALLPALRGRGHTVVASVRGPSSVANEVVVGDIHGDTDWKAAMVKVECVVHLAARVHVMQDRASDPLNEFRKVNVEGTTAAAKAAAAAGARRFVFLSSIKVNGESTSDRPFTDVDPASPRDAYGLSKAEAEAVLRHIGKETGLEIVIVRAPLVYGPGVKGNFLRLLQWVYRGWPLPFARVRNARSLIYVGNLANVLALCMEHPATAGRTFLVSDGMDLSTPMLLNRLGEAMRHPARLWPLPVSFLRALARVAGQAPAVDRLIGSLQVDISTLRNEFAWRPPHSVDDGLSHTADWYLDFRAPQE